MVKVTYEWLEAHMYRGVGLKGKQRRILRLPYPLEKGWKRKVIGMEMSDEDARKFAELGSRPKKKSAENRNSDREFLEKHKALVKARREGRQNACIKAQPFPPSKKPEDFPDLIKFTFDNLEKADISPVSSLHRRSRRA